MLRVGDYLEHNLAEVMPYENHEREVREVEGHGLD